MRKILTFCAIIFICNITKAQNLTIAQILEIKRKDLGKVEEYLTAKGWQFSEANEPTDDKLGSVIFAYNKSSFSSSAESFINFYYTNYSPKTRVSIQLHRKNKYSEYLNAINNYGCKLISTKVKEGRLVKIYRGITTTFEVSSTTSSNGASIWNIFVVSNEDYDLNWGDY